MQIVKHTIGPEQPPFIIAEMSGNHNNSLEQALAIVDAAARGKVHAIKLQTYTADTMTLDICDGEFLIEDPNSQWKGQSLYQLYEKASTPWEWHGTIMERCQELGLICFSTPFDSTAVDFLEELGVPAYKIASPEVIDLPLIRKVARTGKPMIISTGMATVSEVDDAIRAARETGCRDIVLLKCTSTYPASPEESNVLTIPHMRDLFNVEVGLSDHTMGIGVPLAAIACGATMIEKHLTLSRTDGGVDSAFSLEPDEMHTLVVESERAWHSLGKVNYGPTDTEKTSLSFRRSLYISQDLKAGDVLTPENLRCVRPGLGLPPKFYEMLLGRCVNQDAIKGTPMSWELLGLKNE